MTKVVVDASVIVKWYFRERESDLAIGLLASRSVDLAVPDIAIIEVSNAMLRRERDELLDGSVADAAFADLSVVLADPSPSIPLIPRAIEIARLLAHPLADCVYLALAENLDCRLVTADEVFISRLRRGERLLERRVQALADFAA